MTNKIIALIGAGNMGSSLIGGLLQSGFAAHQIWASDADQEKLNSLKEKFAIHTTTDNHHAILNATVIIFAIKPQYFSDVAIPLATTIQKHRPLILSVAAGIRLETLQNWLGPQIAIVRCMPNTPALIRCGATALYSNEHVTAAQKMVAESILHAIGLTVWLSDEAQMDTVTALSGSGPAYFFLVMEALEEAAIQLGLPADISHLLTSQTALGASRMALASDETTKTLRKRVTSPGGTTEKAVAVLEKNFLRETFKEALQAAKNRSEELAKEFST